MKTKQSSIQKTVPNMADSARMLALVRKIANNHKDAIWQDEWFALRDEALGIIHAMNLSSVR